MRVVDRLEAWAKITKRGRVTDVIRVIYQDILTKVFKNLPHQGVRVLEEDWDYLVVLTACRYDAFESLNRIPGRLEKRISLGSSLLEWLEKNFPGYYEDIIYVSGNPRISDHDFKGFKGTDHFAEVINPWDGWEEELNTIPPEEVTKEVLRIKERHRNRRIIIHYLQPHAPWIGKTKITGKELGISFSSPIEWFENASELGPWGMFGIAMNRYDVEKIRNAYLDNVKLVLREVERLLKELNGKVVVTADHGECFGEKFILEHPTSIHIKELVEIPWLVIKDTGSRISS